MKSRILSRIARLAVITAIILTGAGGVSCQDRAPAAEPPPAERPPAPDPGPGPAPAGRPSVFLIVIDATRADALGAYGATGDPSPNLDRLAADGVVFTRAYTASPFTMTSVASIFTGLYPWQHKVMFERGAGLTLDPSLSTLAEYFRAAGYHTAAFSGTYFLLSQSGFARGFETFDESCSQAFFENSADCLNRRITAWLAGPGAAGPNFVSIHYVDPHRPYAPPAAYSEKYTRGLARPADDDTARGEIDQFGQNRKWWQFYRKPSPTDLAWLRGLYQGEVAYADAKVGELLAALAAEPDRPAPIVMVTADHGEAFYEHQVLEHVGDLHDPVMRVPLILWGTSARGLTVTDPVRSVDLMPTLLELAGLKPPREITGRSFAPLLTGARLGPVPAPAIHFLQDQPEYALVLWPWKLFFQPQTGRAALHRLDLDPAENLDLGPERPEQLKNMKGLLDNLLQLGPPRPGLAPPPADLETLERMKRLGYIQDP